MPKFTLSKPCEMKNLLLLFVGITLSIPSFSQYTWTQQNDFPGVARQWSRAFVIGKKGYVVGGKDANNVVTKELWEYSPDDDTWTQKANLVGDARSLMGVGAVNGKGYVFWGGAAGGSTNTLSDTWEYDPIGNTWTQKASFNGQARTTPVSFTINGKIYAGVGYYNTTTLNDFWEYNPATDTWAQKTDFPGDPRRTASGCSAGDFGYLGLGASPQGNTVWYHDWWKYNPLTDAWTQQASFPGEGVGNSVAFDINGQVNVTTGWEDFSYYSKEHWQYNPQNNSWTQLSDFSGVARWGACAFSFGNYAILLEGAVVNGPPTLNDVWRYGSGVSVSELEEITLSVYPNPSNGVFFLSGDLNKTTEIEVYNTEGKQIMKKNINTSSAPYKIDLSGNSKGVYLYQITSGDKIATGKLEVIK